MVKDINSLTPMQARIADVVADERADTIARNYIVKFEKLIDRNMCAALIDYGVDYNDIEGIQNNMSKMLIEDTKKSKKLEEGNFNMAEIEGKVLAAVKELLATEVSKKESIERLQDKFPRLSRSMLVNAYVKVKKEMGLTENRISREIVFAEFDRCAVRLSGTAMVPNAMKKFGFTESTAKTYYSKWKNQYMVDKIEDDPIAPDDVPVVKTAAATKQLEENAKKIIEEAAKERQCIKPIAEPLEENWEKIVQIIKPVQAPVIKEAEVVKVKGLKVIESNVVVRKTVKVEGENGLYEADTENGVSLSKEDRSISFNTIEELDEWVAEFKAVFAMVV